MSIVGEAWEESFNEMKKQLEANILSIESKNAELEKKNALLEEQLGQLPTERPLSENGLPENMRHEPGITDASKELVAELGKVIVPGGRWRMGALLLTYKKPGAKDGEVNIAHGVAAQSLVSVEDALDLVQLAKSLRVLASSVDQVLAGKQSVPGPELSAVFRSKRGT